MNKPDVKAKIMSGIDATTQFAYTKGEEHFWTTVGQWVDGVFAAFSNKIETVDTATQRVPLADPNLQMWQFDQDGNIFLKQITGVQRIKLSSLPAYQLLKFRTQNGAYLVCSSTTPVCTRVNNVVSGKTADQWQSGNMIACSLKSYMLTQASVRPMEYAINNYSAIPSIITATWGELSMSRNDAQNFLQICRDYPESVDPGDEAVFQQVIDESSTYDVVMEITDVTAEYKKEYIYWVETENNCFQIYMNSIMLGMPVPGPVYKPLQRSADVEKHDSGEVLKTFNKVSQIETGPHTLEVKE